MNRITVAVLFLWISTLAAEPPPRLYHVEHYSAIIRLDLAAKELRGEVLIHFRADVDRLRSIELDAGAQLTVLSVDDGGIAQPFTRQSKAVTLDLLKPAALGKRRFVKIRYTAKPANGLVMLASEVYAPYSTTDWMVCNFRPENRATLRLEIHAPRDFTIAANGERSGHRDDGAVQVSVWNQKSAVPPFVFGFAAGEYRETLVNANGTGLRFLARESLADARKVVEAESASILRFLTKTSGMSYRGATYTTVFVTGRPEQELAGFTLLPESYAAGLAKNPEDLWLLAHEFAHQWYGIGIACADWSDFWLNEGIATFLANAFLERRFGRERYEVEIERAHAIYEDLKKAGKDRPLSFHDWTLPSQASGRLVYNKGAWVLHLLRSELGEETFWNGLRIYTKSNWGKAVVSRDLQLAMESAAHRGLDAFFKTWVYESTKP